MLTVRDTTVWRPEAQEMDSSCIVRGSASPLEFWAFVCLPFQAHLPFAVIGSTEELKIGNKMMKARQYPWGTVQGEWVSLLVPSYWRDQFLTCPQSLPFQLGPQTATGVTSRQTGSIPRFSAVSRLSLSLIEIAFLKQKQMYLEQGEKECARKHVYLPKCTRRCTTMSKAVLFIITNN